MTNLKPLTWIATAALSFAVLTGCATAEVAPDSTDAPESASQDTSAEAGWADGYALADVIDRIPADATIVDMKGATVARDAENYLVLNTDESESPMTVNVTRSGWEQVNQLVDIYMPVDAPDTAEVKDTAGNPVDPTALGYVVLGTEMTNRPETASYLITYIVEPNREYDAG